MSDKDKPVAKVEAQPLKPLPMPEYRYQDRQATELSGTVREDKTKSAEKPDLSGLTLNLC